MTSYLLEKRVTGPSETTRTVVLGVTQDRETGRQAAERDAGSALRWQDRGSALLGSKLGYTDWIVREVPTLTV